MSIKVPLTLVEVPDAELIDYGVIPLRILCTIDFEYKDKDSAIPAVTAILDTGATLSVIPKKIWESCKHRILGPSYIAGIVKAETYKIDSQVGIITLILADTIGRRHNITIRAQFASTNEVPLLLGVHGLLDRGDVHLEIKKNNSWIEFI